VRFCLTAHYQQAATLMKRNAVVGRVWLEIDKLRAEFGIPQRTELPLMDAAFGYKVRNLRYREAEDISDVVASRDLKRLCEVGLLEPVGEKRGRYYIASARLRQIASAMNDNTRAANPYELLAAKMKDPQLKLGL
jgi:hypothetical protein